MDNTSVVVEAQRDYVDQVFSIFCRMGYASSLFIKETEVKAMYISRVVMSTDIQSLDCVWNSGENILKLFGFYVGEEILARLFRRHLEN